MFYVFFFLHFFVSFIIVFLNWWDFKLYVYLLRKCWAFILWDTIQFHNFNNLFTRHMMALRLHQFKHTALK